MWLPCEIPTFPHTCTVDFQQNIVFNLQSDGPCLHGDLGPPWYDEGDLNLTRGSQDPGAIAEPNFQTEDAVAIEMAVDSSLDHEDFNLLMGCQDTGVEEINLQIGIQ